MRILLVEDDALIGAAVERALRQAAHALDWVRTLAGARRALALQAYDCVLLDLGLPDGEGLKLVESLRADGGSKVPLLVISARDQIGDRVRALDAGADDYLVKPFDFDELLARLRALGRRGGGKGHSVIHVDGIELDSARQVVFKNGQEIALSAREYQLLAALVEKRGQLLTRQQIEAALYDWGAEIGSNVVEVYIHALRRKLGADLIRTVRGRGYMIDE